MTKKKIKKIVFIIILILLIIIFFYIRYKPYNYEKKYTINNYKIIEKYDIKTEEYTFFINSNNKTYAYRFNSKYIRNKELIKKINAYKNADEVCILPISENLMFYPLCIKGEIIYTYNLSKNQISDYDYKKIQEKNQNYNKININYLNSTNFLINNYNEFIYINEEGLKNIKLFNKDVYRFNLIYQLNEYVIIPDYNEDYYFDKLYLINLKNGKIKEIGAKQKISFDSIFLGDYKNNVYLLDKKEKKEYRININKEKIEVIEFLILQNNKLKKTSYKDIINNNLYFDNKENENYEIIDNQLYQIIDDYKILISNKEVDKIIKEIDNTIYYLSNEELYMYNNNNGEILLITNFEWNFNNTNMIYLYK